MLWEPSFGAALYFLGGHDILTCKVFIDLLSPGAERFTFSVS